ncbi:MAG: helix-turn-helix transcriptional regulator [Zoogloeaceae bacterium]|nr:helix-turn-helix transcriptional regulator [Rhodocyclaceae bacterium]MCP5236284.1 helix-turn-helix transcriptional regulator [Zoogloeaceae bacterium]
MFVFVCRSYKTMPIDRLSALISGLMPRLTLRCAGDPDERVQAGMGDGSGLVIHLLVSGAMRFDHRLAACTLAAPSVVVLRNDVDHRLDDARGTASLMSAEIAFDGPAGDVLVQAFAMPVVAGLEGAGADLVHLLALIRGELAEPRCGRQALLARAGEILLITVLRHLIARPGSAAGILRALADERIARAVVAIHEQPASTWSLESLADRAGMSRTAFAQRFRDEMGQTPGSYLAGLRLAIAERSIGRGEGLKRAARAAGYRSPAALSRALGRRRGSPAELGKGLL